VRELPALAAERGWDEVIVKPEVSAGARGTHLLRRGELARFADEGARGEGRLMVQPFLREVPEAGELSLLFFGGEFSHAVVKHPAPGDFRVQESHGGLTLPYSASSEEIAHARRTLEAHGGKCLYARVDLIPARGGLLLGELELTEPSLFLAYDSGAASRFADAYLSMRF
jgi:glutathione synthase/RimK-type ligase-like ATP-grasp enzyme